jgi:hypothetical protein
MENHRVFTSIFLHFRAFWSFLSPRKYFRKYFSCDTLEKPTTPIDVFSVSGTFFWTPLGIVPAPGVNARGRYAPKLVPDGPPPESGPVLASSRTRTPPKWGVPSALVETGRILMILTSFPSWGIIYRLMLLIPSDSASRRFVYEKKTPFFSILSVFDFFRAAPVQNLKNLLFSHFHRKIIFFRILH